MTTALAVRRIEIRFPLFQNVYCRPKRLINNILVVLIKQQFCMYCHKSEGLFDCE